MEEWANFYKFPFYKRQLDPVEKETGFQDYARNWRKRESLNILDSICQGKSYSDRVVATAHHEDDQLETTLLKLLRGTHISNLYPVSYTPKSFVVPYCAFFVFLVRSAVFSCSEPN